MTGLWEEEKAQNMSCGEFVAGLIVIAIIIVVMISFFSSDEPISLPAGSNGGSGDRDVSAVANCSCSKDLDHIPNSRKKVVK